MDEFKDHLRKLNEAFDEYASEKDEYDSAKQVLDRQYTKMNESWYKLIGWFDAIAEQYGVLEPMESQALAGTDKKSSDIHLKEINDSINQISLDTDKIRVEKPESSDTAAKVDLRPQTAQIRSSPILISPEHFKSVSFVEKLDYLFRKIDHPFINWDKSGVYPRVNILCGCDPLTVKYVLETGMINILNLSFDLAELQDYPKLQEIIRSTEGYGNTIRSISVRFWCIGPEEDDGKDREAVLIGEILPNFKYQRPQPSTNQTNMRIHENGWLQKRRGLGYFVLTSMMEKWVHDKNARIVNTAANFIIISRGKKMNKADAKLERILAMMKRCGYGLSLSGKQTFCKAVGHRYKVCSDCFEKKKGKEDSASSTQGSVLDPSADKMQVDQ